jgi:hypothetical protein
MVRGQLADAREEAAKTAAENARLAPGVGPQPFWAPGGIRSYLGAVRREVPDLPGAGRTHGPGTGANSAGIASGNCGRASSRRRSPGTPDPGCAARISSVTVILPR